MTDLENQLKKEFEELKGRIEKGEKDEYYFVDGGFLNDLKNAIKKVDILQGQLEDFE